jgi:ribosomal protein S18 acetylase RimI-like enzyme
VDELVRRAVVHDCPELERLEAVSRAAIEHVRGGALRLQECAPIADWPALLTSPGAVVLVGSLDDVVVGYLVMLLSAVKDRGVITHVFVEEEARQLGLGDSMIEHAIEAVVDAGLVGIESTALPGDRDTKNLFERAGITARKLTVYKSLRSDDVPG